MDTRRAGARAIFERALEIESSADRRAYLDGACAGADEIRRGVEQLLKAHEEAGNFLEEPARDLRTVLTAAGAAAGVGVGAPLGDFRIVREVGRGGMGVVYEAEQLSLGRRVALKVLSFASALDPRQLQRFRTEAQAAAQLHHTNIVPVYAVGCERGVHFYAMQLIDGQTLAEVIRGVRRLSGLEAADGCPTGPAVAETDGPLAALSTVRSAQGRAYFATVADLGVQAALALDHAHQVGVVHRDVKPANLLVDGRGGLWVTDFGLAHVRGDVQLTLTGDLVGTLRYMSPEQALGRPAVIDHRTDVYSLGATLYELLTLEPAYGGTDRQELLRRIATDDPRPPRRVNRAVPAELETIVLKAMAKSPEDRYPSARELADDLGRFLRHEPIRARRPSAAQVARKWARRHRTLVLAAGGGVVLALTVAVLVLAAKNAEVRAREEEAGREKRNADRALVREREALDRERGANMALTRTLDAHRIALAQSEWRAGRVALAERHLDECRPDGRQWEWHYLKRLCHQDLLTFRAGPPRVSTTAFSADGRWLAVASDAPVLGAPRHAIALWEVGTGRQVRVLGGSDGPVETLAFSLEGQLLAGSTRRATKVWDVATGLEVQTLRGDLSTPRMLAFSPGAGYLATGSNERGKLARIWKVSTGEEVRAFPRPPVAAPTPLLAFDSEARLLLRSGEGVVAWHWGADDPADAVRGVGGWTTGSDAERSCLAVSPDSGQAASATRHGLVTVSNARSGKRLQLLTGHTGPVGGLAFDAAGRLLASGGADKCVRVWDLGSGREAAVFRGHAAPVIRVAFLVGGTQLASVDVKNQVKVWDVSAGPEAVGLHRPAPGPHVIAALAFSPDGRRLLGAADDGTLVEWDVARAEVLRATPGVRPIDRVARGVALSPDGRRLALTARADVEILDATTGRRTCVCQGHDGVVAAAALSPEVGGEFGPQTYLATGGLDKTVRVWDAATGRELVACPGHTAAVRCVAFAPGGRRLASGGADKTLRVWEAATGRELLTLAGHRQAVQCVAFGPDGAVVASAGLDRTIRVWDLSTGRQVHCLTGHEADILSLAFTADGERLASASGDGAMKVWDPKGGREVLSLSGHDGVACCLAFSPDGGRLVSAGVGPVKVWDARPMNRPLSERTDASREP